MEPKTTKTTKTAPRRSSKAPRSAAPTIEAVFETMVALANDAGVIEARIVDRLRSLTEDIWKRHNGTIGYREAMNLASAFLLEGTSDEVEVESVAIAKTIAADVRRSMARARKAAAAEAAAAAPAAPGAADLPGQTPLPLDGATAPAADAGSAG